MENIVLPDYNHCILNLITSILKYYNVETNHTSLKNLDEKLKNKYKNVVFIILDGMGEHILNNLSPEGYFCSKKVDCITSVYPSTTTAALTTYYAGKPPYETGWIAWSQYFKEYGRALDMLSHKESYKGELIKGAKINVFEDINDGVYDESLKEFCKKCNKQTIFRITVLDDGIVGQCSKCREVFSFKIFPKQSSTPIVECPYCHSTNTKKISTVSKAGSVAMFGVFAMGKVSKQWKCENCKSEF